MLIFKYELEKYRTCAIKLPENYQIIKLALQNRIPMVWVLLEENNPHVMNRDVNFYCIMTGESFVWSDFVEPNVDYLDSYQLNELVCHIFCAKRFEKCPKL